MPDFEGRIARCTGLMKGEGIDVLILTKPANMMYLCGDGRLCAFLMVTKDGEVAIGAPGTDREDVESLARFDHFAGFEDEVGMIHSVARFFKQFGIEKGKAGVERAFLPQPRLGMLTHPHAKPEAVEPVDCTALMSALRLVKEDGEIEKMRVAATAAAAGMRAAVEAVRAGVTENDVTAEADYAMRKAGATDMYRSYVSSGPRTNIAHGLPSLRKIEDGDLVMIDLHPVVEGYSSDLCRTVCAGEPLPEQQAAHDAFVEALESTISMVRAGVGMAELEGNMHGLLEKTGHGNHIFGPPIHGIGIEFEEAPLPAGHAFFHGEKTPPPLPAGAVIAVGNCGIYTGPWGVREEDTVAVGEKGPLRLTDYVRSLPSGS